MIVNKTSYCEKDLQVMYRKTKKGTVFIIRTILTLLVDAFSVYWGIYSLSLYMEFEGRGFPAWFPLMIGLLFLVPAMTLYSILTRKKRAAKAMMKQMKDLGYDREFTFTEEGVEAVTSSAAIENKTKYSYDIITEYYAGDDSVYIMMEKGKQRIFMPVHDDGYTEGSKEELISLLESRNVRREAL